MAIIAEIESGLTGAAGVAGAQTIAGAAFTARAADGAGSLHPALMTATLTGTIAATTDQDFVSIYLAAGEALVLDIDGTAVPLDLTLTLFNPSGTLVATATDAAVVDAGSTGLLDPFLTFTVNATGFWVIGLRAVAGTGGYTLNVTRPFLPVLFEGGAANETSPGSTWADTLRGGEGADSLAGQAGADSLEGGGGDDTLLGGAGADTLRGGAGHDRIEVGEAGEGDADLGFGGEGNDTILAFGSNNRLLGEAGDDSLLGGSFGDTLDGGDGADTLLGDAPATAAVLGYDDLLMGGGGHDSLVGMLGADRLDGGLGDDTLWGDLGDALDEGAGGRDTLLGAAGNDRLEGDGGADLLNGGSGADTLVGGTGTDRLLGGAGNDLLVAGRLAEAGPDLEPDTLEGGAGADTLLGAPLDRLLGGEGDDLVVLRWQGAFTAFGLATQRGLADGGEGSDILRLLPGEAIAAITVLPDAGAGGSITVVLDDTAVGDPVTIRFTGFERFDLTGSQGADLLRGGAGADTLRGVAGSDDELSGGEGDDVLIAAEEGLVVAEALLRGEGGADLLLLGGAGSSGALDGGAGADTLVAATGTEALLQGGSGDDVLVLGLGNHVVDGGSGLDLLVADWSGQDDAVFVWSFGDGEGLLGSGAYFADFSGIERFALTGGAGDDELVGGAFSDTLEGRGGADTLDGGLGNDLYGIDSAGDVVLDSGGQDTIRASISWTLDAAMEGLELVAPGLVGIGNGLANWMLGSGGSQTLSGGAGADSLAGGSGNDVYRVDDAGDRLLDGGGLDTVESSVSWSLGGALEALRLVGSDSLNGTGNGLNNLLIGNAAVNTLSGGAGADTLDGGPGGDRLLGGTGDDVFILRLDEAQGERVADFAGNGAAAGDVLMLVGYGPGATLRFVSGATWRVEGPAGWDTFLLAGTFDPAFDVVFA